MCVLPDPIYTSIFKKYVKVTYVCMYMYTVVFKGHKFALLKNEPQKSFQACLLRNTRPLNIHIYTVVHKWR